jgi:hypothetical protein
LQASEGVTMRFFLFLLITISLNAGNEPTQHQRSIFVYAGSVHEIQLNVDGNYVHSAQLYYRTNQADDFKTMKMEKNGFDYSVSIDIPDQNYTKLEYYFVYYDNSGLPKSSPGMNPVMNAYKSNIVKRQQDINFNYEIISPLLNETVDSEDFMVVVSLLDVPPQIDIARTQVMIDGSLISNADISVDYIMYVPQIEYRNGTHNIELNFFDKDGELVNKIEWSAAVQGKPESGIVATAYGRISLNGLNDKNGLSENTRNYTNANANFYGKLSAVDYTARAFISSQDDKLLQPINRFHGRVTYPFARDMFVRAGFGDVSNTFTNQFILNNRNIRGFETALYLGFVNIDFIKGTTKKEIVLNNIALLGNSYERESTAARFSFGHSNSDFELGLSYIKSEDQNFANSITLMNDDPKETLTAGLDLNLRLMDKRITLSAGANASVHQDNIRPDPITYKQLEDQGIDIPESIFDFANSLITIRSIPSIGQALYGSFTMNMFSNYFKVKYEKVTSDFRTEGNPFMLSGYTLLSFYDNVRLVENQLFLNLSYDSYKFNVESDNPNEDNRLTLGVTYYPSNIDYPTVSVKYNSFNQSLTDTTSAALSSTQATNMVNLEVSKDFSLADMMHNAVVNFGTSSKDAGSKDESNLFQLGLQSELNVLPVVTRIQFSSTKSGSELNLEKSSELSFRANYDLKTLLESTITRFDVYAQFNSIKTENTVNTILDNSLTGLEFGTSFTYPFENRTTLNSRLRFRTNSIKPETSSSYTNSVFTYSLEYRF